MRVLHKAMALFPLLALLAACSGIPVSTDYEPSRDYSGLKTYAWKAPAHKIIIDPLIDNDLMTARIERSVKAQLAAQGYVEATGDQAADFYISFSISSEQVISVDSYYGFYGYYPCAGCYGPGYGYGGYGGAGNDLSVRQYTVGALLIDVVDPASERLIWRGVGEKRMPRFKDPQQRDLYIAEIVQAILVHFPPNKFSKGS